MMAYARMYPEVMKCLPSEEIEIDKLPRQYIGNIIYTVVGQAFDDWVQQQIEIRNEKVKTEANMAIEMDAEIA